MIDRLSIVNACLATMGEAPLNTLEEDHSYKAAAEQKIDRSHLNVSSKTYWFNTEWVRALPQSDSKYVLIPQDVIAVEARSQCGRYHVTQRGTRLYDVGKSRYEFDSPVVIKVRRHLDFELLPFEAQSFIEDDAVAMFQSSFDADRAKLQILVEARRESLIRLNSEDIRQKRINLLERRSVRDLMVNSLPGHPWHPHQTFPG